MEEDDPTVLDPGLAPPEGETIRALAVFLALFLLLSGVTGVLAFRELDLKALSRQIEVAKEEAERIADAAAALVRDRGEIDLRKLAVGQKQWVLRRVVQERLRQSPVVRHVEIVDRSGNQVFFLAMDRTMGPSTSVGVRGPEGLPGVDKNLFRSTVGPRSNPDGEVRVAVDPDALLGQLEAWRSSLRTWVAVAATLGILVVLVSFAYVLHLIRKNRRLEQSRLAALRRAEVALLAQGLAHEIRNPLNAMSMNLQMLEEEIQALPGVGAGDHLELLASTKSEIQRLDRLVNNFLAYARPRQPRFEQRDLNEVLNEVGRFLQVDFQQSQVQLSLDLEPLLPTVEIDDTLFKQALMNLLMNARQVLKAGGRVTLRSRASPSGEILVEVQDDGPGVPVEARERIFEVFYSNRGGGTGLGLPIARQIVERHGGQIQLENVEGQGATFRIRLPRRHDRTTPTVPPARTAP